MVKKVSIIYSGAKNWGGVETLTKNLFKYYDKSKIELIFYSLGEWPLTEEIRKEGAQIRVFPKTRFQPLTIFKIAKKAKQEKVELFSSGGLVADSYARAASLFSGIPHLSFAHSDFDLDYHNSAVKFVYKLAVLISRWKTKKYIAVSNYLRKQLLKDGIKPEKVTVIWNGVEEKEILKVKNDRLTLTSIGRLHPVKGYDSLIYAMTKIKDADLLIFGDGSEKEKLEKLISELNLSDRVKLMGYTADTKDVYSKTDIYIQPSKSEGFGLTVVEAMLYGLPIVVTPCGSLPELINDGKTGIVSKSTLPGDIAVAITGLINNEGLRIKIGNEAKNYAKENFDVNEWAGKVTEVFKECSK